MLNHVHSPLDRPRPSLKSGAESACDLLRRADALVAEAIDLLARADVERDTGLPVEMLLRFHARRTMPEARTIAAAAAELRRMPGLRGAFDAGVVSWSQTRAIL
ncbi:MAG TPA: hypothetical protein VI565_12025, partial [Burkholderiales bacterium]|nr:hypothetical protein [Burkholderiales bacterium]